MGGKLKIVLARDLRLKRLNRLVFEFDDLTAAGADHVIMMMTRFLFEAGAPSAKVVLIGNPTLGKKA